MRHLSELERRLEQAAEEVRQATRHAAPPPIPTSGRARAGRGWLVFAAAFVVVVVAVGIVPMLTRGPGPVATSPSTSAPQPTTAPTIPTTTLSGADCSAAGLAPPPDQTGLPAAVADTRQAIIEAAIACDYETLAALAGPDLSTSFGGGTFEDLVRAEEAGEGRLGTLVRLLGTPYASEDYEGLPRHYYWPSAFVYDTWEEIPEADLEALRAIYTDQELDELAAFGSYAGWRVGITEEGDWRFFVAGD